LNLGQIEEAKSPAFSAIRSVEYAKLSPVILADAATVNLLRGNIEVGCELAGMALGEAVVLKSRWALVRLKRLRQLLQTVAPQEAFQLIVQFNALAKLPGS
ncbi:MAG: hypothetical protein ACREP9_01790, partial [Candidatus Dormibacteraceae bacterium]